MMFELNFDVTFNRPVTEEDTVCFDTCEMTMNGKEYSFDFFETSISTTRKDSRTLHVERTRPDFYNFAEAAKIGRRELKNVEKIGEIFVYTGEKEESDLKPVSVSNVCFVLPSERSYSVIAIPKDVVTKAKVYSNID